MPSTIFLPADERRGHDAKRHALIYFVCGNPGLIEFYRDFLECLSELIRTSDVADTVYDVYGRNLLGFSDDDHEPFEEGNKPWDLEGQIEGVHADVAARTRKTADAEQAYDFVVMVGHSVGAYIALEVFERHARDGANMAPDLDLRRGILLFPTLTHIAQSPSGRRMASLQKLPLLEENAHRVARLVLAMLPEGLLVWALERVMGFTSSAAGVTARWLKSRDGVWQAIHLGLSEMRTIREEKWEAGLWEMSHGDNNGVPRFFLFYGREDHWVASKLRDEFVESKQGKARIVVDEGDVPHAFCTREDSSWVIAKKVCEWVEEMEGVSKGSGGR